MSGITDPSEEYFKNGLWGWVANQWKKLIGDDAGHLQVDVVESGLPSGAATSAEQDTMITALQLIDDLQAALTSIHTDSLDVRLDGQTADVEVTQTTAADLTPGITGWDGSAWRRLPLLWGYSDRWVEHAFSAASGGGDAVATTDAVPAGYVYVLQAFHCNHSAATAKKVVVRLTDGNLLICLSWLDPLAASTQATWVGSVTLKEGDTMFATAVAPGDGKKVYLQVWGYKMRVAE